VSGPARRSVLLAALCAGLLLAPHLRAPPGWEVALAGIAVAVAVIARRGGTPLPLLAASAAALTLLGLGLGNARLDAGASDAFADASPGDRVRAEGFVASTPRPLGGATRFPLDTPEGRLGVALDRPAQELRAGMGVAVEGTLTEPEDWLAPLAAREGYALELQASEAEPTVTARGGIDGLLDRARLRAEAGLTAGLDQEQSALMRGFVLGQDEAIDAETRDEFRRSGLAHLLAVSGQNVMLLAILAGVLLAALGVTPRLRLAMIVLAIAIYVPVAGAGPSIQRAGVMGAAAICAGLAGRATDRAWIVLMAVAATLLLDPLSAIDIGWQLSFAAVVGIALWARRIAALAERPLVPRPLADAIGITLAATIATGPLIVHHFGTLSLASLPANLVVTVAVAPVMWIGMVGAGLGQFGVIPTEPLAYGAGPLLDYVAWVARTFAGPGWASVKLAEPSAGETALLTLAVLGGTHAALGALERRRGSAPARVWRLAGATAALLLGFGVLAQSTGSPARPLPSKTLRITAVDVGQGDAILLQQVGRPSVLVDAGPPGAGLADRLRALGVHELGALVLTHADLDHAGGVGEVLRSFDVDRLLLARPAPEATSAARVDAVPVNRLAQGGEVRVGRLRLTVLAPEPTGEPAAEPNAESVVLMAQFAGFSSLLTGDAEAEAAPIAPGPFDVLKVAHHGSADAGLDRLLATSAPRIALVSVGEGNGYGHPDDSTLTTLAEHGVCVLRTDIDGDAGVEIGPAGVVAFAATGLDPSRPGCVARPPF
jgi:competence protein ComEC